MISHMVVIDRTDKETAHLTGGDLHKRLKQLIDEYGFSDKIHMVKYNLEFFKQCSTYAMFTNTAYLDTWSIFGQFIQLLNIKGFSIITYPHIEVAEDVVEFEIDLDNRLVVNYSKEKDYSSYISKTSKELIGVDNFDNSSRIRILGFHIVGNCQDVYTGRRHLKYMFNNYKVIRESDIENLKSKLKYKNKIYLETVGGYLLDINDYKIVTPTYKTFSYNETYNYNQSVVSQLKSKVIKRNVRFPYIVKSDLKRVIDEINEDIENVTKLRLGNTVS